MMFQEEREKVDCSKKLKNGESCCVFRWQHHRHDHDDNYGDNTDDNSDDIGDNDGCLAAYSNHHHHHVKYIQQPSGWLKTIYLWLV